VASTLILSSRGTQPAFWGSLADRVNIYLWIISSLDFGSSSTLEADFAPGLA
jgi:hypothetical protein